MPPSFWLEDRYVPRRPLSGEEECTFAVVGGGITGVAAAYHLARAGQRVILLEKELLGGGASGLGSGLLRTGTERPYAPSQLLLGRQRVRSLWRLTLDNHRLLRELIEREHIPCDYLHRGGYRLATGPAEFDVLCQSVKKMNQDGFRADIVVPAELRRLFPGPSFSGGIHVPDDGELHPIRFVRGLAAAAEHLGARLFEHSPVESIDGTTLKTARGTLRAEMVLLANGVDLPRLQGFFEEALFPALTLGFATDPFPQPFLPAPAGIVGSQITLRQLPDGRFIVTQTRPESPFTPATGEGAIAPLSDFLHENFTATRNLRISHPWSGRTAFSCDDLPSVGPVPGVVHTYVAAGFQGLELSLGVVAAKMVSEMMLEGRTEYPASLLSPYRHAP